MVNTRQWWDGVLLLGTVYGVILAIFGTIIWISVLGDGESGILIVTSFVFSLSCLGWSYTIFRWRSDLEHHLLSLLVLVCTVFMTSYLMLGDLSLPLTENKDFMEFLPLLFPLLLFLLLYVLLPLSTHRQPIRSTTIDT